MKKRVLFIMHMPGPIHGASIVGKYIHESKLINSEFDCKYINLATAKNLNDIGKFRIRKIGNYFSLLFNVVKAIISFKPSVVYITPNSSGRAFYKDFVIVQIVKLFRIRVVVHYHTKGVANMQDKWFDNILYKIFFKDIKIILLSKKLYYDVAKYVDEKNVFICPNAISKQDLVFKKTHAEFNILFLSNMMKEKGVFVLLDACNILKIKNLDFHCNFVGQWSDVTEKKLNKYLDIHQLADKVTAYGAKYGNDKNEFFALADVFVFPTYYHNETFGLVLLEAQQQKITCIASDEGGISDIIVDGKTGYLIPKLDSKALADKIQYLYNHPEINMQMGENGYRRYNEDFTLDIFERKLTDILIKIVHNNKDI